MEAAHAVYRPLAVLESVRCLECGEVYSKPSAGGTVTKNPGCPVCGYVGWIPLSLPDGGEQPNRFAVGRRPHHVRPVR
jgi:hypothetical protein